MKRAVSFAIIISGVTAMVSQIVLIREFLIIFYGNELSIGLILASWLIAGAIGSAVFGRITDRIKFKIAAFAISEIVLAALLILSVFAVRESKSVFGVGSGEIISFFSMAVSSLIILLPLCALLGFMFSLACKIYESGPNLGAIRIGKVYVLEAIGAISGGLITSFFLIRILNSLEIMSVFASLNVLAALAIVITLKEKTRLKIFLIAISAILTTALIFSWLGGSCKRLEKESFEKQWQGHKLISSKNSIYGNIAVVKRAGQLSFFDNGLHLYTVPDDQASEESVHFAMLEHPDPKEILLVGGGYGGLVAEILKHPIERLDYVELDPLIIKMAEEYLPEAYSRPLRDQRVTIINEDGRRFVKMARRRYDCVIVDIGSPYTAQLNRYYTVEFFEEVKRILKEGGILSFGLSASEDYINKELEDFLRSIYATLISVFQDVLVIPGDEARFLSSNRSGILTYDYNILMKRRVSRGIEVKYVREYYLSSRLSEERISYVESLLKKTPSLRINRDFYPISYYYDIIFWATRFKGSILSKALKALTAGRIWGASLALYAIILLTGLFWKRLGGRRRKAALTAVMTTGFSEMTFQVIVLISFQIIYGYVFYKLGLILTSFMIGLALGGWFIVKIMPDIKDDMGVFIKTQFAIFLYPLILPLLFWAFSGQDKGPVMAWIGSNMLFPFLPAIAGFIGGVQFPLANKIYLKREEKAGRVAGLTYGIDLLGSCLGAFLVSAFLIPILGIPGVCFMVSGLNLAVLILLMIS